MGFDPLQPPCALWRPSGCFAPRFDGPVAVAADGVPSASDVGRRTERWAASPYCGQKNPPLKSSPYVMAQTSDTNSPRPQKIPSVLSVSMSISVLDMLERTLASAAIGFPQIHWSERKQITGRVVRRL